MSYAARLEYFADTVEPPPAPRDSIAFSRSLTMPSGEFKGLPYDPDLHPGQRYFLVAYASGRWNNFAIKADTQSGKSWLLQVILFFCICELGLDVLYGLPDMRFAADIWMKKIKPSILGSGLGDHMPKVGSGSGGGTEIDTVYLRNGSINFHGAHARRGAGGNDGRTIPIIINDEGDTLPRAIINKNERRADAFFRLARRIMASTVKDDDDSNIINYIDQSTGARIFPRCPACKGWCEFEWERVSYDNSSDKAAEASARIKCGICGHAMNEQERQNGLRDTRECHRGQQVDGDGNITGAIPDADRYGISWSALDNPFKSLGQIVKWHRAAMIEWEAGRPQDLVDFWHDQLGRQYKREKSDEDLEAGKLVQRSVMSTYKRGEVPAAALFVTVAIDQQKRILAWMAKAHDVAGRTWRIDWNYQNICDNRAEPSPEQRIAAFKQLKSRLDEGFTRQGSKEKMHPVLVGVDVADWPAIVAPWIREQDGWMALHGTGSRQMEGMRRSGKSEKMLEGWYDLRTQAAHGGEWQILWLDSDKVKRYVCEAFARDFDTPGSAMLPKGLNQDGDLIKQLTSEEWKQSKFSGKHEWVQVYRFNEYWDCDYYTQALGQYWLIEHPDYNPHPIVKPRPIMEPSDGSWTGNLGAW